MNIIIKKLKQNIKLWNIFTRKEEYHPLILDKYNRFPYYLSKNRDILEPKVSKFLMENGLNIQYPENKKFAVLLTHDIDNIYRTKLGILRDIGLQLRDRQIKNALINTFKITSYINKKSNPLRNFEKIMKLEKKYNAKSSFYFLTLDKTNQDFNFKIEDLEYELGNIVDKGWEVGLHGGHEAYNNLKELLKEKKRLEGVLGKKVIGYRNHYLRFKVPDTWELLSKAGFKYDATFGYADMVGFRNGMCHPFKPFNLNKNKEIDILEMPLTIMDGTLFDYMKLDFNKAWDVTKRLIDIVEKYNGVITILWHNTYMFDDKLKFYKKILDYSYKKKAWMTSGKEIWKWWKHRSD